MEHLHERWEGQEQYQTLDQATLFFVVISGQNSKTGEEYESEGTMWPGFHVWRVCLSVDCPEKTSFALQEWM